MSIKENCMIVNVTIGEWSGFVFDREATERINAEAGAASDASRLNKRLVPKAAFAKLVSIKGQIRNNLYRYSSPWKDNGDRIMSRTGYMEFADKHQQLVDEFMNERDHVIDHVYAQERERARFRMGNLYNASDFPSPDALKTKFYVTLSIDSVTDANDFRVKMDDATQEKMRADIEAQMSDRLRSVVNDGYERMAKTIGAMAEKLAVPIGEKGSVFRDSLTGNIDELVDLLPAINVLDDPELDAIGQKLRDTLYGIDPVALRKDPVQRSETQQVAVDLLDDLRGLMAAHAQ